MTKEFYQKLPKMADFTFALCSSEGKPKKYIYVYLYNKKKFYTD